MKHEALEQQLTQLEHQSLPQLQGLWQSYFEEPTPLFNKITLVNKLAYRMQELAYGGLSTETRNLLIDLALDKHRKRKSSTLRPVVGTRLMREYDGQEHYVTILVDGFEYRGHRYKSLSAIATLITGTRWSGNAFFGLNPTKAAA